MPRAVKVAIVYFAIASLRLRALRRFWVLVYTLDILVIPFISVLSYTYYITYDSL